LTCLTRRRFKQVDDDRHRGRDEPDQKCDVEKTHALAHSCPFAEICGERHVERCVGSQQVVVDLAVAAAVLERVDPVANIGC
jgi:hypothetical protein